MMNLLRSLLRRLPPSVRKQAWRLYHRLVLASPDRSGRGTPDHSKVVVAGMFSTASGLGEWARSTYACLRDAGYDVIAVDLSPILAPMDYHAEIPLDTFPEDQTGTLILQANAPEVPTCLEGLGLTRGKHWRVIAAWAWELDIFPPGWQQAFPYISEIWSLSDFAARAFMKHPKAPPVRVLPIAVRPSETLTPTAPKPADAPFTVLVLADALSSLSRKNPVGAIAAFRQAFGDDEDCLLVIKVRNLDRQSAAAQPLLAAVAEATNIDLLDQTLSKEDQARLIFEADVLVSLHRAEGFGLGLAEAMMSGVPVITTNWSGNLTFCEADSTVLIGYDLTPVIDPTGHYDLPGAMWAEPDINAAADALTRIRDDCDYAEGLAARGRAKIETICGSDRIASLTAAYLRQPKPGQEQSSLQRKGVQETEDQL